MHRLLFFAAMAAALAQSPSDLTRVKVGEPAPGFELTDSDGKLRRLNEFRGKDVVLVFYRGHW